jgi:hypothetical protein
VTEVVAAGRKRQQPIKLTSALVPSYNAATSHEQADIIAQIVESAQLVRGNAVEMVNEDTRVTREDYTDSSIKGILKQRTFRMTKAANPHLTYGKLTPEHVSSALQLPICFVLHLPFPSKLTLISILIVFNLLPLTPFSNLCLFCGSSPH